MGQDRHEGERKAYDEIYSSSSETFSAEPNHFLIRMMTGRKTGRALDVAMGQGRNAIWLAEHGWSVTGFDISPVAVAQARRLKVDAEVALIVGLALSDRRSADEHVDLTARVEVGHRGGALLPAAITIEVELEAR